MPAATLTTTAVRGTVGRGFEAVRAAADRTTLFRGGAEEAARLHGPFDGFNLSDVFEYLDPPTCRAIYGQLLEASNPGAPSSSLRAFSAARVSSNGVTGLRARCG